MKYLLRKRNFDFIFVYAIEDRTITRKKFFLKDLIIKFRIFEK